MKGPPLNKNTQGPLVPLPYYTPTPTVLSTSVAFFNVRVLSFLQRTFIHSMTFELANSAVSPALSMPNALHGNVLINASSDYCNSTVNTVYSVKITTLS